MSKLITLHKPKDNFELQAIMSIMKENNIPCYSKGEDVQNLFGLGTTGTGFNVITGPIEIQIPEDCLEKASKLLKETVFANDTEDSTDIPEICPACSSPTENKPICPDCGLAFVIKD